MAKCDLCNEEGEWRNILRSNAFEKLDGSDIVVCNDCLNLYANQEFDKLVIKLEGRIRKATEEREEIRKLKR